MNEYKVEHDAAKGWWFIRFGDGVKRYSERGYAEVACDAANTALAAANARVDAWKALATAYSSTPDLDHHSQFTDGPMEGGPSPSDRVDAAWDAIYRIESEAAAKEKP